MTHCTSCVWPSWSKQPAKVGFSGSLMSTIWSPTWHGLPSGFLLTEPVAGRPALIVLPSASEIITDGIVIEGSLPPIVNGLEPELLATIIAAAPAAWALAAFTTKLQPPRSASAIDPAGNPTSGWHASVVVPSPATPSFTSTTFPETPVASGAPPEFAPAAW